MKKKIVKELQRIAVEMPTVMRNTKEHHLVKGSEMILDGITTVPNPKYNADFPGMWPKELPIDPEAMYLQEMPVQIAINHKRKLKQMFKRQGENGVHAYVGAVVQHHQNQISNQ